MPNNNLAIIWGTRRISYAQLDQYCVAVIGHIKGLGIKPGMRVAIAAPACPEYIIALFALWRMGVVAAPVSDRLPVKSAIDYLAKIQAVLLLTSVQIKSKWPGVITRTLFLNEVVGFDARKDARIVEQPFDPPLTQEVTIIATSGTSGEQKAVVHTWGNHFYSAQGAGEMIPLKENDRWCLSLPLYHVAGIAIVVRSFLAKSAIVIPVEEMLEETIIKRQVTHISLVSTQIYRLLKSPSGVEALKSLKYILLGGSAISANILEQLKSLSLSVFTSYGLTEMSSQVATGRVGECIKVLPYRALKISDEGEVCVKGETLFKGYIQAVRLQLPLSSDGWFKTGDLGRMESGCLTILGRKDHMFISGGENIQPEEIERVLLSLKGVIQAVVVAKEDAEFGKRPVAFVQTDPQIKLTDKEIIAHCESYLPRFKIPTAFHPWPQDLIKKGLKISRIEFQGKVVR